MILKQILPFLKDENLQNKDFRSISRDSRTVERGDVYFCLSDDEKLSKQRCDEALKKGATLAVSNFDVLPNVLKVEDARDVFANACKLCYDRACDKMKLIGVTGTNGKTTTTHIIAEMLARNGKKVGLIGTNGVKYDGKTLDSPLTTPDADFLHKTFFDMQNSGVEYVVMEVSAHALAQKRVDGIKFDVGVLTNVTQDHLDYFKSFENYERAKFDFFTKEHIKQAVVCLDDKTGQKLVQQLEVPVLTYGLVSPSDTFAIDVCCSMNGSHFVGNVCDKIVEIKTNLVGQYNVLNSLAALTVCHCLGLGENELARGLNFVNPVEGRFNVVNFNGKHIVIDYAHSPDSLKNVLQTARSLTNKNVYVVFGCGGNRDKLKRPLMGRIAETNADYVCLTDDNPRLEKSLDIISDIEKGMNKPHMVEPNRASAIRKMIDFAQKDDIIVIAGKGAEKYQEIGTQKFAYNDFDAIYSYFKELDPVKKRGKEFYDC